MTLLDARWPRPVSRSHAPMEYRETALGQAILKGTPLQEIVQGASAQYDAVRRRFPDLVPRWSREIGDTVLTEFNDLLRQQVEGRQAWCLALFKEIVVSSRPTQPAKRRSGPTPNGHHLHLGPAVRFLDGVVRLRMKPADAWSGLTGRAQIRSPSGAKLTLHDSFIIDLMTGNNTEQRAWKSACTAHQMRSVPLDDVATVLGGLACGRGLRTITDELWAEGGRPV